jgi:energy-coupling factor transporter ATP-binding protein EcfA2
MKKKIIAFAGPKGVGKTSLAIMIKGILGQGKILSFADPIKDMVEKMGISRSIMNDPKLKNEKLDWLDKSPREILQTLGTDWGREMIDQNIWIKIAENSIKQSDSDLIMFDDCRFQNEVDMIKRNGGHVVELYRPGFDEYTGEHKSELGISDPDDEMNVDTLSFAAEDLIAEFNL